MGKKSIYIERPPDLQDTKQFWQNILEQEVENKRMPSGIWTRGRTEGCTPGGMEELTVEEFKASIARAANLKSQGLNKLPNLGTKQFMSLYESMAKEISWVFQDPEQVSHW